MLQSGVGSLVSIAIYNRVDFDPNAMYQSVFIAVIHKLPIALSLFKLIYNSTSHFENVCRDYCHVHHYLTVDKSCVKAFLFF